jgi:hypothetical protein
MQSFYRVRLEKTEDAARTISVRHVEPELLAEEERCRSSSSVSSIQTTSRAARRSHRVRRALAPDQSPGRRPAPRRARRDHGRRQALVIAGGHVASLHNRLELFDVLGLAAGKPIVAWAAGAMVLTERIVLFTTTRRTAPTSPRCSTAASAWRRAWW